MIELSPQWIDRYRLCPWEFLDALTIDVEGTPVRFGSVIDPWQRADFARIIPGLMRAVGLPIGHLTSIVDGIAPRRAWLERARGHSKSQDVACIVTWALVFAPHVVSGIAAAADTDQARVLTKAIGRIITANPALAAVIEVQRNKVVVIDPNHPGVGSTLEVISSDAGSSFGAICNFIVADEVSHWVQDRALWDSLVSTAAKRASCMLIAITNAGWTSTWQYKVREFVRTSPNWHFSSLDGPQARWITADVLDEQRAMLPPTTFRRLWLNQWVTATDSPLLSEAMIRACVDRFCLWNNGLAPERRETKRRNRELFIGVDIGRTRDRTVITTVEMVEGVFYVREMYVMRNESFAVQRAAITQRILEHHHEVQGVRIDRGGIGMQICEELESEFPRLVEGVTLHESRQGRLAEAVKSAFDRQMIRVPDDRDMIDDFQLVEQTETGASGVPKVRTNRGPTGHADRFWSLALALSATPLDEPWQRRRNALGVPVGIDPSAKKQIDPKNPMAAFADAMKTPAGISGVPTFGSLPKFYDW